MIYENRYITLKVGGFEKMLLTDGIHLASDTSLEELHLFAQTKLGLSRRWFDNHSRHPHYDVVSKPKKKLALEAGAILLKKRALMEHMVASGFWTLSTKEKI